MKDRKRNLLTDSIALFARYLQHEYLANGWLNLEGLHIIYDRQVVDLLLEENPRLALNASPLAKLTDRYMYILPTESKVIRDFLDGYTPFNVFYDAWITYLLEVEAANNVINAKPKPAEERLASLTGSKHTAENVMIVRGKEMRDRQTAQRQVTLAELQARQFIYPYNLTARDIMNLLAFEQPRAGLITRLIAQAPDNIISIYDYYMWIKKELVRRGILVQRVGSRLSIYDNTHLNYDIPQDLLPLVNLDTQNRGQGFEHLTFEEGEIVQDCINDLYMWGLEENKTGSSSVIAPDGIKEHIPTVLTSTFAVSLFDLGFGITYKRTRNPEQKQLKQTTIADLKHHIQKVLVQQQGCTNIWFTNDQKEEGVFLSKVKLKGFLFEVVATLDENTVEAIN